MRSNRSLEQVTNDFPELLHPEVILEKEVLAHFGLVFSAFANLEASMQLVLLLKTMRRKLIERSVKTREEWPEAFEKTESEIFTMTFGTLLKALKAFDNLAERVAQLEALKKSRDYFAHHFFREENSFMHSAQGCMNFIMSMDGLRQAIHSETTYWDEIHRNEFLKIFSVDFEGKVAQMKLEILSKYRADNGERRPGWEKYFGPK